MEHNTFLFIVVVGMSSATAFHTTLPLATGCRSVIKDQGSGSTKLRACAKPIYEAIQVKLTDGLKPTKLRIVDNSQKHAGMISFSINACLKYRTLSSLSLPPSPSLVQGRAVSLRIVFSSISICRTFWTRRAVWRNTFRGFSCKQGIPR